MVEQTNTRRRRVLRLYLITSRSAFKSCNNVILKDKAEKRSSKRDLLEKIVVTTLIIIYIIFEIILIYLQEQYYITYQLFEKVQKTTGLEPQNSKISVFISK